jgi:hypothetical protein
MRCLLDRNVSLLTDMPDRGAQLLYLAVANRELRLVTTLVQRGAAYDYVVHGQHTPQAGRHRFDDGFGLLHVALANRKEVRVNHLRYQG